MTTTFHPEAHDADVPFWQYLELIEHRITQAPRSLQKRIGPSEIGTPCDRKLALKLSGAAEKARGPAWRPTVGTAVHAWLEECFGAADQVLADGRTRFLTERRVTVGEIDGSILDGSCDLFDRAYGNVLDWKIVGAATLKKVKRHGPGETYRTQAHSYGLGYVNEGEDVRHVTIAFLPSSGELSEAVWWTEPFDRSIADEGIARVDALAAGVRILGAEAIIPFTSKFNDYCAYCPFYERNAPDDSVSQCSGIDMGVSAPVTAEKFLGL